MNQAATETRLPFWLKGNFGPIYKHTTADSLPVEGAIPAELNGRYLRIGPDPKFGHSDHWFLGDGMVHGIELNAGKVNWYRSRHVKTAAYDRDGDYDVMASLGGLDQSLANTHVISHAGRILALEELHLPYELTPELDTVGAYDFNGKLQTGMTAHPKVCGKNGELLFFAYGLVPPYLTYHRVSAAGELVQSEQIEVKGATMVHDFNVTENFIIFMDLPLTFDISDLSKPGIPLKWDEDYGARLGVMPRDGSNDDVTWYDIDPCYAYHPVNAYEDGDDIVIDVCRSSSVMKQDVQVWPVLHRWTIDRRAGRVTETPLDDVPVEFPRVPDRLVGQPYRYGYMVELDRKNGSCGVAVRKHDFVDNSHETFHLAASQRCGEPVFVPAEGAVNEDDGYLLFFIYDELADNSEFLILDARNLQAEPLARVKLPVRVPYGFHGNWIAD
jgi:carotenoid cleavage dioxygenase